MYQQVGEELADAGVADHTDEAAWIYNQGSIVEESDAYGCKVNLNITYPYWVLVMDEIGGKTNNKGDVSVGGELQMCE